MKSFCIKTNNSQIKNYLLKYIAEINLDNIYYICRKFKIYDNIIVHYKGQQIDEFINLLSGIITNCILIINEPALIRRSINYNYFYFDDFEKRVIEDICYSYIVSNEDDTIKLRRNEVSHEVLEYLYNEKSMILDGFINFRLTNYLITIDDIVEYAVNRFVIEKEYNEFISLLKMYIDSKEVQTDLVHLIYSNGESILLDSNRNIITLNNDSLDSKYLSDISFSSNDYALNTLLTLLPKNIEIHIIGYEDEFINTLKLIFEKRVTICNECNICRTYRILNNTNKV